MNIEDLPNSLQERLENYQLSRMPEYIDHIYDLYELGQTNPELPPKEALERINVVDFVIQLVSTLIHEKGLYDFWLFLPIDNMGGLDVREHIYDVLEVLSGAHETIMVKESLEEQFFMDKLLRDAYLIGSEIDPNSYNPPLLSNLSFELPPIDDNIFGLN